MDHVADAAVGRLTLRRTAAINVRRTAFGIRFSGRVAA
jgi:hypothetical protein